MSRTPSVFPPLSEDAKFNLVAGTVAMVTMVSSIVAFWWIWALVQPPAPKPIPESAVYVNYDPSNPNLTGEALSAMQAYTAAAEEPKNVQVLKGWSRSQIAAYMVAQVAGGLKVNCTYCHNIAPDAEGVPQFYLDEDPADPNATWAIKKKTARAMLLMSGDLNRTYVSKLPASVGNYQITCATCHNGKAQFQTYPTEIQNTLPNDYRLPLDIISDDPNYPGLEGAPSDPSGLVVTGREDVSLDAVEMNQYTMYHMNVSLGQGCTFCHNARYFPGYDIPQKQHAVWMLQMSKHINNNYSTIMAGKTPSCWMCHQGNRVPPGAAKEGQIPDVLSTTSK